MKKEPKSKFTSRLLGSNVIVGRKLMKYDVWFFKIYAVRLVMGLRKSLYRRRIFEYLRINCLGNSFEMFKIFTKEVILRSILVV